MALDSLLNPRECMYLVWSTSSIFLCIAMYIFMSIWEISGSEENDNFLASNHIRDWLIDWANLVNHERQGRVHMCVIQ